MARIRVNVDEEGKETDWVHGHSPLERLHCPPQLPCLRLCAGSLSQLVRGVLVHRASTPPSKKRSSGEPEPFQTGRFFRFPHPVRKWLGGSIRAASMPCGRSPSLSRTPGKPPSPPCPCFTPSPAFADPLGGTPSPPLSHLLFSSRGWNSGLSGCLVTKWRSSSAWNERHAVSHPCSNLSRSITPLCRSLVLQSPTAKHHDHTKPATPANNAAPIHAQCC